MHSGLMGSAKSCGTERYARVFTGIVTSSVEVGETDKRLEVVPDEVFVGDSSYTTAIANQACLDADIQVGDKWLFYLYRDPKSDSLVLDYNSPSGPTSDAEDNISVLRDLSHHPDKGLLIGSIYRSGNKDKDSAPLANHKVVAKNVSTHVQFDAFSNEKGHFKFLLPVGRYDVTIAPEYGLQETNPEFVLGLSLGLSLSGSIPVEMGQCWEHNFAVEPVGDVKPNTNGIKGQGQPAKRNR